MASVVYYRSDDCKLQVYWSPRACEINCMIVPIGAPNVRGLYDRSGMWHHLKEFTEKPNLARLRGRPFGPSEEVRLAASELRERGVVGVISPKVSHNSTFGGPAEVCRTRRPQGSGGSRVADWTRQPPRAWSCWR